MNYDGSIFNASVPLVLPEILTQSNTNKRVIAFEGVDGCGKSTLCQQLGENYSGFRFVPIPHDYVSMPFKEYLTFSASYIGKALVYAASLADRKERAERLDSQVTNVVMDRSLWSTIALSYARYPDLAQDITNLFSSIAKYIPIPDIVYVLDVPYEICRERIAQRSRDAQRFDIMPMEDYRRHMDFYYWLDKQGVGVRIFNRGHALSVKECADTIYHEIVGESL